ncbi:hypothetical protein Lal_00010747 [Lupinus albus]|nr:hypothetical protein Lal_00010747 [Lupinus albus]
MGGKYYLVDAGYRTPPGYLGPYKCERYHLPEFKRVTGFNSQNEVFKYHHSSLRNTIERIFSVWKNRQNNISDPEFKIVDDHDGDIPNVDDDANNDGDDFGDIVEHMDNISSEHMCLVRDSIRDEIIKTFI